MSLMFSLLRTSRIIRMILNARTTVAAEEKLESVEKKAEDETKIGGDDNETIKSIPGVVEILFETETNELHEHFSVEDDSEGIVHVYESGHHYLGHAIMSHGHSKRVYSNEECYCVFKNIVIHNVVEVTAKPWRWFDFFNELLR